MRLYLASRSPRRRELLHQIGIDFDTVVFRDGMRADSETDETPIPGETPVEYVERVARALTQWVPQSRLLIRLGTLIQRDADRLDEAVHSLVSETAGPRWSRAARARLRWYRR